MDTGNTVLLRNLIDQGAVQPRGYGEHFARPCLLDLANGSAPWIRGTPLNISVTSVAIRFSPVDTGNTKIPPNLAGVKPVQPRGYGEHIPAHAVELK